MKIARLLEEEGLKKGMGIAKRIALKLQAELSDQLNVITSIELGKLGPDFDYNNGGIEVRCFGPLIEISLDVLHNWEQGKKLSEFVLRARAPALKSFRGVMLLNASLLTSPFDVERWMNPDRVVRRLTSLKHDDRDMLANNYLWFDKIAHNLPKRFKLELYDTRFDNEIMTSKIIETDMGKPVRTFAISFDHDPTKGYCYKIGPWTTKERRFINDVDGLHDVLENGFDNHS